jgi:GNAT superfamily N-acetyltransferase
MAATASPSAADPLADIPTLTTHHIPTARNPEDAEARIAALKLVTDSIAQQRQTANSTLIFHPYNLAITAVIVSVVVQILRLKMNMDWLGAGLSSMGVLMAGMAVIRILTQGYIARAEEMSLEWLGDDDEKLKEGEKPSNVWVTKYGQEIIGAVVVDWLQAKDGGKKSQGQIKGWAVRMRYRGKGVGTALLEEVVQEARKKGVAQGDVVFAKNHASEFSPILTLIVVAIFSRGTVLTCFNANRFSSRPTSTLQQAHGQARRAKSGDFGFSANRLCSVKCANLWCIDDNWVKIEEGIFDEKKGIDGIEDDFEWPHVWSPAGSHLPSK